jgi:hypothetical protein
MATIFEDPTTQAKKDFYTDQYKDMSGVDLIGHMDPALKSKYGVSGAREDDLTASQVAALNANQEAILNDVSNRYANTSDQGNFIHDFIGSNIEWIVPVAMAVMGGAAALQTAPVSAATSVAPAAAPGVVTSSPIAGLAAAEAAATGGAVGGGIAASAAPVASTALNPSTPGILSAGQISAPQAATVAPTSSTALGTGAPAYMAQNHPAMYSQMTTIAPAEKAAAVVSTGAANNTALTETTGNIGLETGQPAYMAQNHPEMYAHMTKILPAEESLAEAALAYITENPMESLAMAQMAGPLLGGLVGSDDETASERVLPQEPKEEAVIEHPIFEPPRTSKSIRPTKSLDIEKPKWEAPERKPVAQSEEPVVPEEPYVFKAPAITKRKPVSHKTMRKTKDKTPSTLRKPILVAINETEKKDKEKKDEVYQIFEEVLG